MHRLIESVKEKDTWVFMTYKVFWGSGSAPWQFSDIGAHQDLPKFVMPELLIKELWMHLLLIKLL